MPETPYIEGFNEGMKIGLKDSQGGVWFFGALFFGLLSVLAALGTCYPIKNGPSNAYPSSEQSHEYDLGYYSGYTQISRERAVYSALTGWVIGTIALLLIVWFSIIKPQLELIATLRDLSPYR
jgi:hypothetical protein